MATHGDMFGSCVFVFEPLVTQAALIVSGQRS